jgi:hypothetical protein
MIKNPKLPKPGKLGEFWKNEDGAKDDKKNRTCFR